MGKFDDFGYYKLCFIVVFTPGFLVLVLWLSLRPSMPVCSMEHFEVPFNKAGDSKSNRSSATGNSIYYDLKLENRNKDEAIYYDDLTLTFYNDNNRSFAIGNANLPGFKQEKEKSTYWAGTVEARGVKREAAAAAAANGSAAFRVDLATSVRFKIVLWKTKRHELKVGHELQVNDQGSLITKKKNGVKLTSGAGKHRGYLALVGMLGAPALIHLWGI